MEPDLTTPPHRRGEVLAVVVQVPGAESSYRPDQGMAVLHTDDPVWRLCVGVSVCAGEGEGEGEGRKGGGGSSV